MFISHPISQYHSQNPPNTPPKGGGDLVLSLKVHSLPLPPFLNLSLSWRHGVFHMCILLLHCCHNHTHFHQIFWWKKITIYFWIAWFFCFFVFWVFFISMCVLLQWWFFFSPFNVCSFFGFEFYCYHITKDVF